VAEDWRLSIELDAEGTLASVANEIIAELGDSVGLHRADNTLVAYADSPEAAVAAEHRLREALDRSALGHLTTSVEHWNHAGQEWQDAAGNPTESDGDEDEPNTPPNSWAVTVALPHHHEAKQLSEQLKAEGGTRPRPGTP